MDTIATLQEQRANSALTPPAVVSEKTDNFESERLLESAEVECTHKSLCMWGRVILISALIWVGGTLLVLSTFRF